VEEIWSSQAYLGHRNIQHVVRHTELARTVQGFPVVADMGISRRKLEATRMTRGVRVLRTEARAADLAAIVAELRAGGATLQAIAAALNERGIPTATGVGGWRRHQVWRVLARQRRCPD
jgi:hypothetical protein